MRLDLGGAWDEHLLMRAAAAAAYFAELKVKKA